MVGAIRIGAEHRLGEERRDELHLWIVLGVPDNDRLLDALVGVADLTLLKTLLGELLAYLAGQTAFVAPIEHGHDDVGGLEGAADVGGHTRRDLRAGWGSGECSYAQFGGHQKDGDEDEQRDGGRHQTQDVTGSRAHGRGSVQVENACVQGLTLLQGGAQCAVQTILQVELTAPRHDMCEEIAVEGGILLEQVVEVQGALGRGQLVESHLHRRNLGPLLLGVAMVRVGSPVTNSFEDHIAILPVSVQHSRLPGDLCRDVGGSRFRMGSRSAVMTACPSPEGTLDKHCSRNIRWAISGQGASVGAVRHPFCE